MKLIEEIYHATSKFPKEEIYGIISQMKRAVVSVASNLAEGCARKSNQEKIQFLTISRGSLSEIDAQLEIALRLHFMNEEEYNKLINRVERVSRMLQGLISSRNKITQLPNHLIT